MSLIIKHNALLCNLIAINPHSTLSQDKIQRPLFLCLCVCVLLIHFIDRERRRERQKHRFVIPLIYSFIGWFLCVPWPGVKPTTLAYQDDALTNWTAWTGLLFLFWHKEYALAICKHRTNKEHSHMIMLLEQKKVFDNIQCNVSTQNLGKTYIE